MSQGDAFCERLLQRKIAVVRPDYEGIGGPGEHPYLHGPSLAASMLGMVAARREFDERIGDDWIAAGHSEGAHAALWASNAPEPDMAARLRGTVAFTPVSRLHITIGVMRRIPIRFPGSGVVSALMGMMLHGAAVTDSRLAELLADDGLTAEARALAAHIGDRPLTELAATESWGGLPPGRIAGPRGKELYARLWAFFRANDPLRLSGFRAPVRIDYGFFDEVAPFPITLALVRAYRRSRVDLTARCWPSHHSGVMRDRWAPRAAAEWVAACFSRAG